MSARPLTELEIQLLLDCANGHDIRSSDRPSDRARQVLRRQGLVEYVGAPKRWRVTERGNEIAILNEARP